MTLTRDFQAGTAHAQHAHKWRPTPIFWPPHKAHTHPVSRPTGKHPKLAVQKTRFKIRCKTGKNALSKMRNMATARVQSLTSNQHGRLTKRIVTLACHDNTQCHATTTDECHDISHDLGVSRDIDTRFSGRHSSCPTRAQMTADAHFFGPSHKAHTHPVSS